MNGSRLDEMRVACSDLGDAGKLLVPVGPHVREVLVEAGRAVGVVTEKGEVIRARSVVSNLNPKLLYGSLIDPAVLPLLVGRALRAFTDGYVAVLLPAYLLALGFGELHADRRYPPKARFFPLCSRHQTNGGGRKLSVIS
jgi:hypothetical protein